MFLLLLCLETVNVKAQVRIGGNGAPNAAAVLDLNANDDATPTGNMRALALPRVSLASTSANLNGAIPITGMLVYNTNVSMTNGSGVGMYFWDGSRWVMVSPFAPAPPLTAHLSVSVDTTLTLAPINPSAYVFVPASRALVGDLCPAYGAYLFVTADNGRLILTNLGPGPTDVLQLRLVCYHPSLTN